MEKYIQFDMALTKLMNESGIDNGAMYYILKTFLMKVENAYYAEVNSQQMAKEAKDNAPESI